MLTLAFNFFRGKVLYLQKPSARPRMMVFFLRYLKRVDPPTRRKNTNICTYDLFLS
jgi:hypothetical protein